MASGKLVCGKCLESEKSAGKCIYMLINDSKEYRKNLPHVVCRSVASDRRRTLEDKIIIIKWQF